VPEKRTWTRSELPGALNRALEAAIERGAKLPVAMRLTEVAGYTDWALLLSARSDRQVRGIIDGIREALAAPTPAGEEPVELLGSDGLDHYLWALLDYGDFLIHVFYHPVRRHYDLESMWSDAPRAELELPAELLDASELDGLTAPDPMPDFRGDLAFGGFDDEFVDDDDGDGDDEDPEFVDDDEFGDDDGDDDLFEDDEDDEPALPAAGGRATLTVVEGGTASAGEDANDDDDDLFDP